MVTWSYEWWMFQRQSKFIYTVCHTNWDNARIKWNWLLSSRVLNPLLFTVYLDDLLKELRESGVGCYKDSKIQRFKDLFLPRKHIIYTMDIHGHMYVPITYTHIQLYTHTYMNGMFTGAFFSADDITLLALPRRYISHNYVVCDNYTLKHGVTFNSTKSFISGLKKQWSGVGFCYDFEWCKIVFSTLFGCLWSGSYILEY